MVYVLLSTGEAKTLYKLLTKAKIRRGLAKLEIATIVHKLEKGFNWDADVRSYLR